MPAPGQAAADRPSPAEPPARRFMGLIGLCRARLQALTGVRIARVTGWAIAAGFALAMVVTDTAAQPARPGSLALYGLGWLAWVTAGLAALSASQDLAARDDV